MFHVLFYSSPCGGQDSFCKQKQMYNSQRALSAAQNTENARVVFRLHDLTWFAERKKKINKYHEKFSEGKSAYSYLGSPENNNVDY